MHRFAAVLTPGRGLESGREGCVTQCVKDSLELED